ncbi:MSMEG_1061 family FMN-dependent PPOX-type flavoprotein [Phreatobacter sp. AB_2022a]|uniref:MSMEG_1061 family FMN-dependent PPOX-type flavoprotein n=1 Tax=Phreatobacter sp. AB_2022a TaxID=3003134 RepID=UPI002286FC77|nr:MSMEG_1061 family FMN-dependent PPOX-type flavoprotein [Phreatobacter sp. AB_2022a]MCZ0732779.1 pyridoxamine 5'-phosphate oxidase family protein [Phreatobacter sp. AB_2022a]
MTEITDVATLREAYTDPGDLARKKIMPRLDTHARRFIALSPFLTVASSSASGTDCSPRGDAPGFVTVVDDTTLLVPDRRGNNLLDTLQNVLAKPEVGLLFFVPGLNETLRVNGRARIVTDPAVLQSMAIRGTIVPSSAMEVTIEQVYFHCGRSLLRARLWNAEHQIKREDFPLLGTIIADQIQGVDGDKANQSLEIAYTTNLY